MRHGGDRVAEVLQAHGVQRLFTLCGGHISPILSAAKARGIRVVDVRDEVTAVFAADAIARLTGMPGVAAVTAGPGITNTITALKNAQLAQSPVVLLGGAAPTALQGRGALQDIDQRPLVEPHVKRFLQDARACATWARPWPRRSRWRARACPGRCSSSARSTCCTTRPRSASGMPTPPARATALADRALRWYLNRHAAAHVRRQPARRRADARSRCAVPRAARRRRCTRRAAALAQGRAAAAGDRQPGGGARRPRPTRWPRRCEQLGVPVYLSGMARGLLGRDHPLQLRHQRREALREADCVLLAGVPCDFRLDYGRHVRRSATLIAANRSAQRRAAEPPARHRRARRRRAVPRRRWPPPAPQPRPRWAGWMRHAARARRRARGRDRRAGRGAAASTSTRWRSSARSRPRPATTRILVADGGDFVATASYVLHPRGAADLARPRRVRHARRRRRLRAGRGAGAAGRARCGSSSATAPAARAWPSSTPSCATASR